MTDDFYSALCARFPPERVSWRVGSTTKDKAKGMALAYIDARDVMARLDEVCSPGGWQARYPFAGCCEIGINCPEAGWVWKANGAGVTDVEAEKGQFSDAFKRAAVLWGIGRYLYDLSSPWVALVPAGNSYRIADDEVARLMELLAKDALRASGWKNPTERKTYATELMRAWGSNDPHKMRELWDELTNDQREDVWRDFNTVQHREMKELLAQTAPKQEQAA